MRRLCRRAGALLSGLVLGCAPSAGPAAVQKALSTYADALRERDPKRLRALLASEDRARLTEQALAAALAAHPEEADALAALLVRAPKPRIVALTVLADGTEIALTHTDHGFRIVDPLTRLYDQRTPRATLESFLRAVARGRWDVVRSLLPLAVQGRLDAARLRADYEARREHWTRLVALLAEYRQAPIEIVGERASMPYAESFTARFVREAGLWKLESPE